MFILIREKVFLTKPDTDKHELEIECIYMRERERGDMHIFGNRKEKDWRRYAPSEPCCFSRPYNACLAYASRRTCRPTPSFPIMDLNSPLSKKQQKKKKVWLLNNILIETILSSMILQTLKWKANERVLMGFTII